MKLTYCSNKLEKILTSQRLIKKEYTQVYTSLIVRLSELRAANSLDEIPHTPPPKRHILTGNYSGCWAVCVSKNYRIIFKPTGLWEIDDLKSITEIEILTISDYH